LNPEWQDGEDNNSEEAMYMWVQINKLL
jgi:hypothetical protein